MNDSYMNIVLFIAAILLIVIFCKQIYKEYFSRKKNIVQNNDLILDPKMEKIDQIPSASLLPVPGSKYTLFEEESH